jgi:hypothetical protein
MTNLSSEEASASVDGPCRIASATALLLTPIFLYAAGQSGDHAPPPTWGVMSFIMRDLHPI